MTDELSVEKIPWQINANPHSLGRPLNMVALLLTKRSRKIALTEKNLHVLNILTHDLWCRDSNHDTEGTLFPSLFMFFLDFHLLTFPGTLAYIGPGLGAGAVVAVLGTLAGLLMLLVGVIWYPMKRLIRRFKSKK